MLTVTDLFAGLGGSSTGMAQVPGVEVVLAANHWKLAMDTHQANHPTVAHDCADISQVNPKRYPATDILWASPECTNMSQARGRRADLLVPDAQGNLLPDEAAERSRATMWDVPRFAEYHGYRAIVVENVIDARGWCPEYRQKGSCTRCRRRGTTSCGSLFESWLTSMAACGYEHRVLYLNSMFAHAGGAPAPQSRDRMYVVFWREGDPAPDFDRWTRPLGDCPTCERKVYAVQTWKKPHPYWGEWGRYGRNGQYLYRCPHCATSVSPAVLGAESAIDWSIPAQSIGSRARELSPKTMARIEEAVRRFAAPCQIPVEGREGKQPIPMARPFRTLTARAETGFLIPLRNNNVIKPVSEPFDTFCASGNHQALVLDYNGPARPVSEPFPTFTTVEGNALSSVEIDVQDCLFRMFTSREIANGMAFPGEYVLLGTKRQNAHLCGNAVTPPNARDLISAVAERLHGELPAAA